MRRDDEFFEIERSGDGVVSFKTLPLYSIRGLRKTTGTLGVVCVPVENRIRKILSYIGIITVVTNLICTWLIIKINVLFSTH